MEKKEITHPSFGMISASRVSGNANLFMVDYPQQHYIRISICPASVQRDISHDWVHGRNLSLIEVDMSEVQFARMISSMNTSGVPCTIARGYNPATGKYEMHECPADHIAKKPVFEREVRERAQRASDCMATVIEKLAAALSQPTVKKGDIKAILEAASDAKRSLADNLPYVVKSAEEAIEKSLESAKAEIDAYHEHALQQIGERAVGSMIERGATVKQLISGTQTSEV